MGIESLEDTRHHFFFLTSKTNFPSQYARSFGGKSINGVVTGSTFSFSSKVVCEGAKVALCEEAHAFHSLIPHSVVSLVLFGTALSHNSVSCLLVTGFAKRDEHAPSIARQKIQCD